MRHRTSFTSLNSTKEAAHKAYAMARLNPSDIQFAEVHDVFTPFEIIGTEDLGFFSAGEGWRALEEGTTLLRGRLPINPSGGLMARGHPVGASVLAQLAEIVYQLRGQAGTERQLERAEIGLAHSIGGLGSANLVTILERTDGKRILKARRPPFGESRNPDDPCETSASKKRVPALPPMGVGTLETFTTLYAVPEGFRSPITLGLVKTESGEVVMACNPDYRSPEALKMGQEVSLKTQEGLYVFEKLTFWNRLKHRIKK
jgi:uncharacterized OB-fold protein